MPQHIPNELVERMVALVREMATGAYVTIESGVIRPPLLSEAHAIAELLPDPDLIEAREVVLEGQWSPEYREEIERGVHDHTPAVRFALSGIQRGRALERGEG